MHINDDTRIKFIQYSRGLYYYDTTNMENYNTTNQVSDFYFLNTLQSKKSPFFKHEVEEADAERIPLQLVGWKLIQAIKEAVK